MKKDGFAIRLLEWFEREKRALPWRKTADPYAIWVSEVVLQQTRVKQGIAYYERFIENFPDVGSLALSDSNHLMRVWEGLGYYSRARNMQSAARQIMEEFSGSVPDRYDQLLRLKGVGRYTAAAIASIAFNRPHAVLDGNVFRFLARYFGIAQPVDSLQGRRVFEELANEMLDQTNPGRFNQAMMEFGALVCKPRKPECSGCIFHQDCYACTHGVVMDLPVKTSKPKVRTRYFHFLVFLDKKGQTLIERRVGKDIWKGLHQFPLFECGNADDKPEFEGDLLSVSGLIRHTLSHQQIQARFWHIRVENLPALPGVFPISKEELRSFAFPRLITRYLEQEMKPGR